MISVADLIKRAEAIKAPTRNTASPSELLLVDVCEALRERLPDDLSTVPDGDCQASATTTAELVKLCGLIRAAYEHFHPEPPAPKRPRKR